MNKGSSISSFQPTAWTRKRTSSVGTTPPTRLEGRVILNNEHNRDIIHVFRSLVDLAINCFRQNKAPFGSFQQEVPLRCCWIALRQS